MSVSTPPGCRAGSESANEDGERAMVAAQYRTCAAACRRGRTSAVAENSSLAAPLQPAAAIASAASFTTASLDLLSSWVATSTAQKTRLSPALPLPRASMSQPFATLAAASAIACMHVGAVHPSAIAGSSHCWFITNCQSTTGRNWLKRIHVCSIRCGPTNQRCYKQTVQLAASLHSRRSAQQTRFCYAPRPPPECIPVVPHLERSDRPDLILFIEFPTALPQ